MAEYQLVGGTPTLKKEYGYRNGQLLVIAEATGTCQWLVADALGTPRMLVDQTGSLGGIKRRDYLPFGEELQAGIGHRQASDGYGAAQGMRQQFTGKERDDETGLDYFEARYYSNVLGRFTSPDEFTGGPDELYDFAETASDNPSFYAELTDPQSLNKYQYCHNLPLTYVDPDGHSGTVIGAVIGAAAGAVVAIVEGKSAKEVGKAALSGGIAGAIAGSIIDTGGASLGVLALAGAAGGVGGGITQRALDGQRTTIQNVVVDAAFGAAGGVAGGVAGRVITRTAQRILGPSAQFDKLRVGPNAGEPVPATGPRVTRTQRARVAANSEVCHTCGSNSPKYVGDHQPATGLAVRGNTQNLYRQCATCSNGPGGQSQSAQVRAQNRIWREQQRRGSVGGAGGGAGAASERENQ